MHNSRFSSFGDWSPSLTAALEFECECFLSSCHHLKFSLTHAQQVCFTHAQYKEDHVLHHVVALDLVVKTHKLDSFDYLLAVWLFSTLLLSSKVSQLVHVSR